MTEPIRIAMWSGPRNISTAMMRSFANRPDTSVIDEPFYAAYLAATVLAQTSGLVIQPFRFDAVQPAVLAGVILLGALAGLLPALLAYRTEVAENLAPLS